MLEKNLDRMSEYMSDRMAEIMSKYVSDRMSVGRDHSKKVILLGFMGNKKAGNSRKANKKTK